MPMTHPVPTMRHRQDLRWNLDRHEIRTLYKSSRTRQLSHCRRYVVLYLAACNMQINKRLALHAVCGVPRLSLDGSWPSGSRRLAHHVGSQTTASDFSVRILCFNSWQTCPWLRNYLCINSIQTPLVNTSRDYFKLHLNLQLVVRRNYITNFFGDKYLPALTWQEVHFWLHRAPRTQIPNSQNS